MGTIQSAGQKYVVATYYNLGGVYANIYQYVFGTGLVPVTTGYLISSNGRKPRIDSHLDYAIGITYEEPGVGIFVKAIHTGLTIGNNILVAGSSNGRIPDIAFDHTTGLNLRIAYYDNAAPGIKVEHLDFFTILGAVGTMPFNFDHISAPVQIEYLDLDCPDHSGDVRWAYTYIQSNILYATSFCNTLAATPFNFMVNDLSIYNSLSARKPSIAYSNNTNELNIAWSHRAWTGGNNHTVAVKRDVAGAYITPFGSYLLMATMVPMVPPFYGLNSLTAISKRNETDDLFAVYSILDAGVNYEMRYKFKPYPMFTYRQEDNSIITKQNISLYPNPFSESITLDIDQVSSDETILISGYDLSGRVIFRKSDNINNINAALRELSPKLTAGMYSFNVQYGTVQQIIKVVKQ